MENFIQLDLLSPTSSSYFSIQFNFHYMLQVNL